MAQPSFTKSGNILTMSNLNVKVQYDLSSGNAAFYWQNLKIISAFYSGIGFTANYGYLKGIDYANWTYSVVSSNQVTVMATGNGHPTMKQTFTFDATNSFLVQVQAVGTNLSANWMGPVVVDAANGVDIHSYGDDRALFVPFDNDDFISYNGMSINSSSTSYEVGAFYDNVSRNGLVVGSVTHDTWKSGVYWSGAANVLAQMNVFGGANSYDVTHDVQPHGSVTGNTISSPIMFVGYGPDWRKTMEDYANENTRFVPKLPWTNGVPFGWNSWYILQNNVSYADATNASAFVHGNLQYSNFNNNGTVYINLDSFWDNFTSQIPSFVNYCHANGQKAGIYLAPYAWFGAASNAPTSIVPGPIPYTFDQIILKTTNGAYENDGIGLALDPTHPGTQQLVSYYLNEFMNWGIDYLKLDFLTHASLEGVHYNTNVVTGIQAYNLGMQYIYNVVGNRMFINESIAPLFPYQYAHSRRIACDAGTSTIGNTAYTLNSVTYGWWLDRLYAFNDPDVMVFDGPTTNENQSRLISGAITGIFLNGDSYLDSTSQADAINNLTNASINAVASMGQTFLASEQNTGTGAAGVFAKQYGTTWYLAVFNYSTSNSLVTNVDVSRAGISGAFNAVDLWRGVSNLMSGTTLPVSLNPGQGKLFQMVATPILRSARAGTNGAFSFSLVGAAGSVYAVDATTDFSSWNTVATVTNTNGTAVVTLTNVSAPMNYYRARLAQ